MMWQGDSFNSALKEWEVAIAALLQGDMLLLLRKGGIRESGFAITHSRIWLYPTYEHQKPHLLKAPYGDRVHTVTAGWHPETVPIQARAEIDRVLTISDEAGLAALQPFHIWTEAFVTERLRWRPSEPLQILFLRVYRLPEVQTIPYQKQYGGCKSWIDLEGDWQAIAATATPVLETPVYEQRVQQIERTLGLEATPIAKTQDSGCHFPKE